MMHTLSNPALQRTAPDVTAHASHRLRPSPPAHGPCRPPRVAYADGSVTASVAFRACSFRGAALIVPTGIDAGLVAVALRGRGLFVEGPIPAAAIEA